MGGGEGTTRLGLKEYEVITVQNSADGVTQKRVKTRKIII